MKKVLDYRKSMDTYHPESRRKFWGKLVSSLINVKNGNKLWMGLLPDISPENFD